MDSAQAAPLEKAVATAASGSSVDAVIDRVVRQRTPVQKLSAHDAQVLREQLQAQYQSLSSVEQRRIFAAALAAKSDEAASATIDALANAVQANARAMAADMVAQSTKSRLQQNQQLTPKLGGGDDDLVFVATAGPCRVADTRFGIFVDWPGPIAGGGARQIYVYSVIAGYDWSLYQGGTGTAGAGNCAGTVFTGTAPVAVVATISVTNTSSTGALRAWNGGTFLTTGAVAAWSPFGTQANTTVVAIDRSIPLYPGSGPFKKDIGVQNNSGTPIDVVVDVVGYFIENTATPLQCTNVTNSSISTANVDVVVSAAACPAGYTPTGINCASSASGGDGVKVIKSYISPLGGGTPTTGTCRFENTGGASQTYWGYLTCCRVPGR
ncbi:MAG: hypothetical protein IT518_17990 [Burkholderiales bacterium]|nr:hypothetical protein [Burkholderiales bacterium]